MKNGYKVVSLFAGIGGICLGFEQVGFEIIWANEIDEAACKTYRHNFHDNRLRAGDIRTYHENDIPKADVLVAGFPCQSFSKGGFEKGFHDPRGTLFFEVIRVAKNVQPRAIFLENVENLRDHDNGHTFQTIYASLVEMGYMIHYRSMPTHEYSGIPQSRRRIYIVAFKDLQSCDRFRYPDPIPLQSDAISMIDLTTKQNDIYYYNADDSYERYINDFVKDKKRLYRIFKGRIRIASEGLCPTLTASMTNKRNAVALRDDYGVRRLTLRESLMFQGFPKGFYFPNTISVENAYKQIGNSVTVPVIRRIAEKIYNAL